MELKAEQIGRQNAGLIGGVGEFDIAMCAAIYCRVQLDPPGYIGLSYR
jgi:hypothetical protein